MAGRETPELARAAEAGGADLIEIGFPFSDPLADGPVIRRAAERALAEGMRTAACLENLRAIRARSSGAARPDDVRVAARGLRLGALRAMRAPPAASLIVADLPVDVHPELRRVQLVAPTSTDERIALAAERTDGWLYLVTVAGTTGARAELSPALAPLVERARASPTCRCTPASGSRRRSRRLPLPSSPTASSSARRRCSPRRTARRARALRRSASRGARLSDEPVARDVPCLGHRRRCARSARCA